MSYSESLIQTENRRVYLRREYERLSEQLKKCWTGTVCDPEYIKQLQDRIYQIYQELRENNKSEDPLNPEQRKILYDADFHTLRKLYLKCKKEKMPNYDLVDELEKEIYRKWIKESKCGAKRIYKLDPSITYRK